MLRGVVAAELIIRPDLLRGAIGELDFFQRNRRPEHLELATDVIRGLVAGHGPQAVLVSDVVRGTMFVGEYMMCLVGGRGVEKNVWTSWCTSCGD